MAVIDNPAAIRYLNEVVRPLCEELRALKARIDAARATYDAGIGDYYYGHGGDAVEDGRAAEGVSRLVGNDVLGFVQFALYDLKAAFEAQGIAATIAKPCVRTLQAS